MMFHMMGEYVLLVFFQVPIQVIGAQIEKLIARIESKYNHLGRPNANH